MHRWSRLILWRSIGVIERAEPHKETVKTRKKGIFKALILLAFILAATYLIRFTSVKEYFARGPLSRLLDAAGFGLR
jgi:hypothetical protein